MRPQSPLPIACGVTDAYVLPLLVMLTSLKAHLRPTLEPVLYLLHRGLGADDLAAISATVETRPLLLPASSVPPVLEGRTLPPEAASPLLLPDVLPANVPRVLFLDADVLVLDDVGVLWEEQLGPRALAAAPDGAIPRCGSPRAVKDRHALGVPDNARYFNAGVLLMDLDAWRQRSIAPRALEYLERVGNRADFVHQEALNAVAWNDWLPLQARWNLLASVAGRRFDSYGPDARGRPGIVHFAGRVKPWRVPVGGHFDEAYQAVLARVTPPAVRRRPTRLELLVSFYDRRCRDFLYPCERFLWNRRIV